MADKKQLESNIYRLKDQSSLKKLFVDLNYDHTDEPVDKENWNDDQQMIIGESRIIAKLGDFRIFFVESEGGKINELKNIITKIISKYDGKAFIFTQIKKNENNWMCSSLSKDFSKNFRESRHFQFEIKSNEGVPKTILEFFEKISVDKDNAIQISKKISNAFDNFALELHNELTVNVFEAMKNISEGIIENKNNKLELSFENLEKIREPIFILLYRIIFVSYAEDRGIFPVSNEHYYEKFSLKKIKKDLLLKSSQTFKPDEYDIQERMKNLFHLIEIGSEELEIPQDKLKMRSYYGRLFDRKIHNKLETWKISNKYILSALDSLSRTRDKKGNYFFLDYSVLEIRHLGAIYEHLLEFHLTIKGKKIAELPNPEDRRESGSYYTPKHVVEHAVKEAIEPFIKKIDEESIETDVKIEKILSLKVLDPAMGSGHFLVGVVEYVAKRICEIEHNEVLENDFIERKRDVVRRCIYGVDANELAVDLAKVSLWLDTLSSTKPLSFLSAHLKHGNSLLGGKFEEIFDPQQTLTETISRTHLKKVVRDFLGFESMEDDTSSAVKAKIEKYQKMHGVNSFYSKFRGILDNIIAGKFGIKVPPIGDLRQKIGEESIDFYSSDSGHSVFELRKKHKFFHWELEFPEIFYDMDGKEKKNKGFDIIVGNPPWVFTRGEHFSKEEKEYFDSYIKKTLELLQEKVGKNIQSGKLNLYSLFLLYLIPILKQDGILSFVIPNNILRTTTYDLIRKFILENCKIRTIVNLGAGVFEGVTAGSIILSLQREKKPKIRDENKTIVLHEIKDLLNKNYKINEIQQNVFKTNPSYAFNILADEESLNIFKKIEKSSECLGEISKYIIAGIASFKEKTVFDGKKGDKYKPFIVGKDVGRYKIDYKGKFILYDKKILQRARPEEVFLSNKVLVQRISGGDKPLIATYDDEKYYTFNSVNNIILKDNVKYYHEYITAILNSNLINWYYSNNYSNKSKVTVNISKTYLEKLPIRKISMESQKNIRKMVNEVISLKKNLAQTSKENAVDEINSLEERIDSEIYDIYEIDSKTKDVIEKSFMMNKMQ